MKDDSLKGWH